MDRRAFMLMLGAGLAAATPLAAQSYADQIVGQLVDQGFRNIEVEVTFLGRVWIRGESGEGIREIILNPKTGEILRDLWLDLDGNPKLPRLMESGRGSDKDDSEDDDEDDRDDDEDDSDNSGSGSSDD